MSRLRAKSFLPALFAILPLSSAFLLPQAGATIRYQVSLARPQEHVFHVTMEVPRVGGTLVVAMPAWNALYQIRNFAYHVTGVRAEEVGLVAGSQGAQLAVLKLDKQTWKISAKIQSRDRAPLGTVEIDYDTYWNEPNPFSSQLNQHHAFVNLAEVLFYVPDRRGEESVVEYVDIPSKWKVAAELPRSSAPDSFSAASYDALVDAPAELGQFTEFRFDAAGARFRVVVDGRAWNQLILTELLRRIVTYEISLMHGAPFPEYLFLFHFGPYNEVGGGGMEHSNSTAIAARAGDETGEVAAHEFFHLWNVKRIRPQSLEPVDYTKEMWTRSLWFAEGVTSTYASYTLIRSGLWDRSQFYADLAEQFAELDSRPAHHWQSVEESSLDAWLEKYDYYNRPDVSISYYNKGQILGVLLDLEIRDATNNRASLDDVLRKLNKEYAQRGRFYHDSAGIRAAVEAVASRSFEDFFGRYVSGTEDIPYDEFLAKAGLRLKPGTQVVADFGFWTSRAPGGALRVAQLTPGSNAELAGLREGDALVGLNGAPFPRDPWRWLKAHSPKERVTLRVLRDGAAKEISFALGMRAGLRYEIEEIPHPSEKQLRIREGLLRGKTD